MKQLLILILCLITAGGLVGPYFSFPLKENYDYGCENDSSYSPLFESDFGYFDLGLKLGIGILYKFKNVGLFGEIRYNLGYGHPIMDNYFNSSNIEATAGILFQLPQKK